jgi:UDP-N-acetylglucosamine 2-epimerase (non-hydrolysing)
VNRRVIDECSDLLMPYTERSREHLLREGFAANGPTGRPC